MSGIVWPMNMTSIKKRLLFSLFAVIVVSTLISTILTYFELKHEMDELFDENMKQIAHAIAVHDMTEHSDFVDHNQDIRRTLKGEEEFLIQVWQDNTISFSSKPHIEFPNHGAGGVKTITYNNEEWRFYGLDAGKNWLVQISQPIPMRHTVIWEIYFEQLIPTLSMFPILMGLVWFMVGWGFLPLERVSQSIEQRTATFLEKLPENDIPKEVFTMVQAINRLLDRLSEALNTQRRFTADAAHELRTPLTAVRLELDVLKRADTEEEKQESLQKLYNAVDRSARLVHQLLEMARREADHADDQVSNISLYKSAQSIISEMEQVAKNKNISLRIEGNEQLMVRGRPYALSVLMSNLVANALQYTAQGGIVIVFVYEKNGKPILSVSDNGRGISVKEQERIFDRFYRINDISQSEVTGSGLGLSIVKSITESHNAAINILDGIEGKGVTFQITFPQNHF